MGVAWVDSFNASAFDTSMIVEKGVKPWRLQKHRHEDNYNNR